VGPRAAAQLDVEPLFLVVAQLDRWIEYCVLAADHPVHDEDDLLGLLRKRRCREREAKKRGRGKRQRKPLQILFHTTSLLVCSKVLMDRPGLLPPCPGAP